MANKSVRQRFEELYAATPDDGEGLLVSWHLANGIQSELSKLEEERKIATGYYGEAQEGWTKFRVAEARIKELECDRDGLMSAIERISHERNEAASILRRFVNFAKEPPESLDTLLSMGNRIAADAEALLKKVPPSSGDGSE